MNATTIAAFIAAHPVNPAATLIGMDSGTIRPDAAFNALGIRTDSDVDDATDMIDEYLDENGCPGHESLAGAHMGESVFCYGSANSPCII